MTEKELQANVLELAKINSWLFFHAYDSRRSQPGFPDLVMLRYDRLIFVELKSAKGRLRPEQVMWQQGLEVVQTRKAVRRNEHNLLPEVYLWRPSDWLDGTIERVLA